MKKRKGIILAGGAGTRLYPLTAIMSKQLLPIFDKPMIYYPLSTLMLAGIREILVITTPRDIAQFKLLLGDGSQWGISLDYKVQENPNGLAEAFILGEDFLDGSASAMILGDNVFYGHDIKNVLRTVAAHTTGATVFGYRVSDPQRFGVVGYDNDGIVTSITEKPAVPLSNYAVTGLYFLDASASERAKQVSLSERGELEITSLLNSYLAEETLSVKKLGRGYSWFDTGTNSSLLEAGNFVRTITNRTGLQIGSPDEIAYSEQWISREKLIANANIYSKNDYGQYLLNLEE